MGVRTTSFLVAIIATLSMAMLAAGCGDDDGSGGNRVNVSLGEWDIQPNSLSAAAGDTTFRAKNNGTIAHELVIIKTDMDPAQLPMSGGKVDEDKAGKVVDEIAEFAAGKTESGTFKLDAGHYALICNITGHYQSGMHAGLTVR